MEPIGTALDGALQMLGDAPCPTDGCKGIGSRVKLFDTEIALACEECQGRAEAERAEKERQDRADLLLGRSGRTPRISEWSFGTYPQDAAGQEALAVARRWVEAIMGSLPPYRTVPNLLLYGPVGGGKTGLGWGIVRYLCEQGVEARLVDFPTLLEQMKDAYAKRVPFNRFSDLGRIAVLVLDDVGAERPTEWARSQLLALVNNRYERCLPTCYLSNYDPDDLGERISARNDEVTGQRIVSRMVEGSMQHRMKAEDRREPG